MRQRNQASVPLCPQAKWLQETADVLFSRITEHTTPEQFSQCLEALSSLHEELVAELKAIGRFHYSAPTGSLHRCVTQVYRDVKAQLRIVGHLQPEPEAASHQLLTAAGVVLEMEERLRTNRTETHLGTDDPPSPNGNPR